KAVSNSVALAVFPGRGQRDRINVVGNDFTALVACVRTIAIDAQAGADHLTQLIAGRICPAAIGVSELFNLRCQGTAAFDADREPELMAGLGKSGFAQPYPIDYGGPRGEVW